MHPNVKATIAYVSGFATKVAGMDVQLVTNGRDYGFTGQYDRQGNTMLVDITALTERVKSADAKGRKDNSKFVVSTVAHEVTHWMEEKAPELYAQYDKMVMDALTSNGRTEAEVLGRRRALLEKAEAKRAAKENRKPREITDKEVRREVIARASEDMLALSEEGKKYFESLTENEQKQLVDKIKEVIKNIKDWIKNVLSNLKSDAPEAQELRALAKDLDAISKKWDEMLRASAKANAAMKKAGVNDKAIMESKTSDTQNADIDSVFTKNGVEDYTERQYNRYGWAIVNNLLSKQEIGAFLSAIGNQSSAPLDKYSRDQYVVAVGNYNKARNTLVITDGNFDSPSIDTIIRINLNNETDIDELRRLMTDSYGWSSTFESDFDKDVFGETLIQRYNITDFPSYQELRGRGQSQSKRNNGGKDNQNHQREQRRNRDSEETGNVEVKYSDIDSEGNKLSAEQQEYFKDSVIRNANGNLMPMYHGTEHGGFTVFGGRKDYWYFSNSKKYSYTFAGRKKNGQFYPSTKEGIEKGYYNSEIYKVYLDVKNPFVTDDVDVVEYALYWDKSLAGKLREQGYDALMLEDMSQVIVLNANQIKRVDNKLPTVDPDIRYSDIDAEGNELSEGQIAFFKDSKVRNSQGALIPVYHGTVADFTIFDREFGNSEGDFGRGFYFTNTPEDVEINYANEEGPDLINKIEHWADMHEDEFDSHEDAVEAAREKYVTAEPHTIKAYLNMTNPVELFNSERGTYLDYEESYDEETDEYGEPEGLLIDFVGALQNNESNFDVWRSPDYWSILGDRIYDGGLYLVDAIQMLKNQIFEDIQDEEGNLALNELIRMALEDMGYDGIIDHTVSHKFKNMKGMSPATTHYIVFNSNQAKKTDNLTPTNDPDIRYSDIDDLDDLNAQLKEKQNQIYSVTMELRKFDAKAEEEKLYAVLNKEGASQEELDKALQDYSNWGKESGYADAYEKQSALKDEEKLLRREIQKVEDRLHDELKEKIAHWDDEDVKKYVAKAVRKYHTTTRLDKASYLVTTGSMLDFSDGQGYRVKDHREISEILDLPDYAEYSDGMIAFMNMGNIRLQTYGIDVSAMPNAKQFTALRDIIFTVMRDNDEFSVDFSKTDGYSDGIQCIIRLQMYCICSYTRD